MAGKSDDRFGPDPELGEQRSGQNSPGPPSIVATTEYDAGQR